MRLGCLLAGLLALLLTGAATAAAPLPRVASLSVCADQYVLALAAPGQIAALSPDAADPALSFAAAAAADYPRLAPSAEALLGVDADLVVSDGYGDRSTRLLARRLGMAVLPLPPGETLADVRATMAMLGGRIGRAAATAEAIAAFDARLARLRAGQAQTGPSALYLLPTGTTAGRGTYLDEVLTAAGLSNDAARRGLRGWGPVSLEALLVDPPALFITSFFDRQSRTTVAGFGASPVARALLEAVPRLEMPNALWICAGPMLIDAAEHLATHYRAAMP